MARVPSCSCPSRPTAGSSTTSSVTALPGPRISAASRSGDRTGGSVNLEVRRIGVRDLGKARDADAPAGLFTTDWKSVVEDPAVDIVVELIGGVEVADRLVREALQAKKHVVTANKALLAERGASLFALAETNGCDLYFEAAVAAALDFAEADGHTLVVVTADHETGGFTLGAKQDEAEPVTLPALEKLPGHPFHHIESVGPPGIHIRGIHAT